MAKCASRKRAEVELYVGSSTVAEAEAVKPWSQPEPGAVAIAGAVVVAGDVKYGCPGVESVLYNLQHASRRCKNNKKSNERKNRKRVPWGKSKRGA